MHKHIVLMVFALASSLVFAVQFGIPPAKTEMLVTVKFHPDTLLLKERDGQYGQWITCVIDFSKEYNLTNIDFDSIRLEGVDPVFPPIAVTWINTQGNKVLAKFDRMTVVSYILEALAHMQMSSSFIERVVKLEVFGTLLNGEISFEGSDTIRVLYT